MEGKSLNALRWPKIIVDYLMQFEQPISIKLKFKFIHDRARQLSIRPNFKYSE